MNEREMDLLRELEARLEDAAGRVMQTPAGSAARAEAEALYRRHSETTREVLARDLEGWRDPLEREVYLEGLRARQRNSQEREGRR